MTKSGSSRWVWPWVIGSVIFICAATLIFLRHRYPKLITTEDIAIAAASITLMTTVLAYWSARASGDAARESRRALQLHYQPGKIRIGFSARDPQMQQTSSPGQLWVSLAF